MGLVGGPRRYGGATLTAPAAAWKCPSCGSEQVGDPDAGCAVCGAGTAKAYKAAEPAAPAESKPLVYGAAERWAEAHPDASLAEAFVAGFTLAQASTMQAPPVTADLAALAPAGKPARTILAALRLFRDQVLRDADEEIESGEWCSLEEVDRLILQLEEQSRAESA